MTSGRANPGNHVSRDFLVSSRSGLRGAAHPIRCLASFKIPTRPNRFSLIRACAGCKRVRASGVSVRVRVRRAVCKRARVRARAPGVSVRVPVLPDVRVRMRQE